jgi:hypothetical protein
MHTILTELQPHNKGWWVAGSVSSKEMLALHQTPEWPSKLDVNIHARSLSSIYERMVNTEVRDTPQLSESSRDCILAWLQCDVEG